VTDVEMEGVHESLLKEGLSTNPHLLPFGHVIGKASGDILSHTMDH